MNQWVRPLIASHFCKRGERNGNLSEGLYIELLESF